MNYNHLQLTKNKIPHPRTRIENALDECRFNVDPFKSVDVQVKEVISLLKPLIPLSFEAIRIAIRIPEALQQRAKDCKVIRGKRRMAIQRRLGLHYRNSSCKKGNMISSLMKAAPVLR